MFENKEWGYIFFLIPWLDRIAKTMTKRVSKALVDVQQNRVQWRALTDGDVCQTDEA